jgi:hypothetical protein
MATVTPSLTTKIETVNSSLLNAAPGDPGHHVDRGGRRIADVHDAGRTSRHERRGDTSQQVTAK